MDKIEENFYITKLLKNLCCSDCGSDFDHYKVLRQDGNILVLNIICPNCGKDFGTCILSMCNLEHQSSDVVALDLQDGPDLITVDEVIDANNMLKNLKSYHFEQNPKRKS